MTDLSEYILSSFQRRHFYREKTAFIELLRKHYPDLKVDGPTGLLKSRNLIIGDVDTAEIVFTAHYDTCSVFFMPNLVFVNNIIATILYSFLMIVPVIAVSILIIMAGAYLGAGVWIVPATLYTMLILFLVLVMWGIPSSHTANDNTSGVITLIELYEKMTEEQRKKTAVVFFDNEELGLIGSYAFKRKYSKIMKEKLLVNFDCVSDGDNMLFVFSSNAKDLRDTVGSCFRDKSFSPLLKLSSTTMYPSDQANFRKHIGVASMHHCLLGYYIPRIHTARDVIFDRSNIESLTAGFTVFIDMYNA